MDLQDKAIDDAQSNPEGGSDPPRTGFTPDVLPEIRSPLAAENSQKGVSTNCVLTGNEPSGVPSVTPSVTPSNTPSSGITSAPSSYIPSNSANKEHWYVLRATYGRVKQSCEYLAGEGITVYHPTIYVYRKVNGKRKRVEESRLPNIFFARSTEEILKSYVYDNVNLPYLRFYYRHYGIGSDMRREPLVVPDRQMQSLMIICGHKEADNIIVPQDDHRFEKGETVLVTGGDFKGVIGKVTRYCGQLRVGVIVEGLLTITTAYVPRGYLKRIEPKGT